MNERGENIGKQGNAEPSPIPPKIHQSEEGPLLRETRAQQTEPTKPSWYRRIFGLRNSNGWIAFFTLILTCAAIGQWVVMHRQWQTMEQTLRIDQRAWVGIKTFTLTQLEANKPLRVDLSLTDAGKTVGVVNSTIAAIHPAFGEDDIEKYVASREWQQIERQRSNTPTVPSVMFPNLEFVLPLVSSGPVTQEQFTMIQSGNIFIYVLGEIYYTDIFHTNRSTGFCVFYSPTFQRFQMCRHHNWAD